MSKMAYTMQATLSSEKLSFFAIAHQTWTQVLVQVDWSSLMRALFFYDLQGKDRLYTATQPRVPPILVNGELDAYIKSVMVAQ